MNKLTIIASMNNSTLSCAAHLVFENSIGRLLVHPSGHYIAIEYHPGPRQPSELQAFLMQAGKVLFEWGWDKLLTAHLSMPDFAQEEIEDIKAYWRTNPLQCRGLLYGALLLPHAVFAQLSWNGSLAGAVALMPSPYATEWEAPLALPLLDSATK
jgi:hypothetical protein